MPLIKLATQVLREVGKGPSQIREWGAIHDDVGGPETASVNEPLTAFDCYRCRERLRAESVDERKGNDVVAMLLIGVLGVIVGIIIGVSLCSTPRGAPSSTPKRTGWRAS